MAWHWASAYATFLPERKPVQGRENVYALASASLNTDHRFALDNTGRKDGREKRSLLQPGISLSHG